MKATKELAPSVGTVAACTALGIPRPSFYRWLRPRPRVEKRCSSSPRALSCEERETVVDVLNSERFVDLAPAAVYSILLDEGMYLCSIRTMYRLLAERREVRERRNQLQHPVYTKPELLATGPNEVWSWDITKLLGPRKWTYYYLYVILDIYSRYVVGWLLAERESADLAKRLIRETVKKYDVDENQLTLHSDRGPSMGSKLVAQLLADLGVTKSHSRPHVSNDNPFSEAQFKTMKYRREFPQRFGSLEDGRGFCLNFTRWYNEEHRHSAIGLMTPASVHYGKATEIRDSRQEVLSEAYHHHPERFVLKKPEPPALPDAVWINPPEGATVGCQGESEGGGGKSAPSVQSEECDTKFDGLMSQSC